MMAMAISGALFAQVPQKFNYQGIARDTKGNPMAQQRMTLKLTVLPTSDATEGEYEEIQSVTTNEFGLYNLQIGNGTPVKGEMKTVKWETGNKYIKVAIDPKGGNDFVDAGTTQLLSVPYAIYADKAGMAKNTGSTSRATNNFIEKTNGSGVVNSTSQIFDNGTNIGIGTTTPSAKFHINQNVAGVQEHMRMQNLSTTGAGRFTLYSDGASNYSTFTKYGSAFAGNYVGLTGLYPNGNLLAFGNNGLASGDGLGRFLISSGGNVGISMLKGGTSKLKFHADFTTENVGIGGNAAPVSRVHLNNTDGTTMDLRLTNTTTGQTATDGMTITMTGNSASINNRENAALTLGTNNTTRMTVTAAGNVEVANQIQIAGGAPGVGKVLTSDATGLATWQTPSGGGGGISGSGTLNYVPKFTPNGTTLGNSQLFDNGTNVGIGTLTPSAKLTITTSADSALISDATFERDSATGNYFGSQSANFSLANMVFGMTGEVNGADYGAGVFGRGFGAIYAPFTTRDIGVYGSSNFNNSAIGVLGSSDNGTGVMGLAASGIAGFFKAALGTAILADSGNVLVNTGGVGIGTLTPTEKLDVNGKTILRDTLFVNSGSLNTHMRIQSNGTSSLQFNRGSGNWSMNMRSGSVGTTEFYTQFEGIGAENSRFIIGGDGNDFVIPGNDNTMSLGTTSNKWSNVVSNNLTMTNGAAAGAILTSDAFGNASWNTKAKGTIEQMSSSAPNASAIVNGAVTFISGDRLQVVITSSTQVVHYTGSVTLGSISVGGAQGLNIYPSYNNTNAPSPVTSIGFGTFGLRCVQNSRQTYTVTGTVTGLTPGTYYFGVGGNSLDAVNWNNNEFGYQSIFVLNN